MPTEVIWHNEHKGTYNYTMSRKCYMTLVASDANDMGRTVNFVSQNIKIHPQRCKHNLSFVSRKLMPYTSFAPLCMLYLTLVYKKQTVFYNTVIKHYAFYTWHQQVGQFNQISTSDVLLQFCLYFFMITHTGDGF